MKANRGLGRGLDALMPEIPQEDARERVMMLRMGDIDPNPEQPRRKFDAQALAELAASIRQVGVLQPILVTEIEGRYRIIAGERRWRAARLAELEEIPAIVRPLDEIERMEAALIENIQREDLNPLEEAQGLARLVKEFNYTHEQAAQAVGRSRSAASNLLRLLNLAEPVQTMLMAGDLDMGHARALLALDRAEQINAANQIAAKKLSVREAENLVKKMAESADGTASAKAQKPAKSRDVLRVEEELSDLLMAQVEVRVKKRVKRDGKFHDMGELAIQFGSLEELNGLIEKLRA